MIVRFYANFAMWQITPRPHIHIADAFQVKTGSGYCTRSQFFNQIP